MSPTTTELSPRWLHGRRQWRLVMECPCGRLESRRRVEDPRERELATLDLRALHRQSWPDCPHREPDARVGTHHPEPTKEAHR